MAATVHGDALPAVTTAPEGRKHGRTHGALILLLVTSIASKKVSVHATFPT